ncbi:MAG: RluA family pseudouridine synthase [Candidatus Obscuribacterales bacterium]|nr:RluA family pseudouridine synthase [Candidatus Obscuribacterales bacterium]
MPQMPTNEETVLTIVVHLDAGNSLRLDKYLSEQLEELSRQRIQKLIDDEKIFVNGKTSKASHKLVGGEELEIHIPAVKDLDVKAEDIPLSIIFEDEHLIVVNKPAGMTTHPGAGVQEGTLVNALLHHCRGALSGIGGVARPGIVHRLDKDTSGLLVVAKNDQAHWNLADQIKHKRAKRVYMSLLEGVMPLDEGIVDKPIGRHPTRRKEMAIVADGRNAVSHYTVVSRFSAYTLVKVALETGRTHQIRVHMASLGYPVVGDIVYNKKNTGSLAKRHKMGITGQFLHAAYLSFMHPVTGDHLEFHAPLPDDLDRLVKSLK